MALLVARVFFKNAGLVELVSLQTDTAFIAFVIQSGARAGLRKEYLIGHIRLVRLLELYLRRVWIFVFPPVSVAAVYFFQGSFLPIIYGLNAIITLLIGLSLIRQDVKSAGMFSTLLFLMNFGSGMILIMAGAWGWDNTTAGMAIEGISCLLGVFFVFHRGQGIRYNRGFHLLMAVLRKYLGLQISSFVIMFSVYIFAQLVISVANSGDAPLIVMYSDAILISGLLTLVLSRALLLFEQRLIKTGKVEIYLWLIHSGFFIFIALTTMLRGGAYSEMLMFFLLLMGLIGRFSIALVSGYIDEKWRKEFMVGVALLTGIQGVMFGLQKTEFWQNDYLYYAAAINMYVLSFLMIFVYRYRQGAYISNRGATTEQVLDATELAKPRFRYPSLSSGLAGVHGYVYGRLLQPFRHLHFMLTQEHKMNTAITPVQATDSAASLNLPPQNPGFMTSGDYSMPAWQQSCMGVWVSFGDFMLTYIFPLVFYGFAVTEGRDIFVYPEITAPLLLVFTVVLLLFFTVVRPFSFLFSSVISGFYRIIPFLGRRFHTLFAISYMALAAVYLLSSLSFNRYDSVAASEELGNTAIVALVLFCKVIASAQIFYFLVLRLDKHVFGQFYWWCIFCALVLTVDGMAHIMLIGLVLWFLLSTRTLYNFLNSGLLQNLSYKLYATALVACLFILGMAFKAKSMDVFAETISDTNYFVTKLYWLVDRVATIYFSAGYAINHSVIDPELNARSWAIVINESKYRWCMLTTGWDCAQYRDAYGSMSRFNFANISVVDPERGGASPGVIGSAAYLFPIYLSPLIAILYYSLVSSFVDTVVGYQAKGTALTLVGMIIYGYLLRIIYLNPVSLLDPMSSPFIGLMGFVFVSAQFYHLRRAS